MSFLSPVPFEKDVKDSFEVTEAQVSICDEAFDLVELCKMGGVECLVSKHPIDGEVFARLKDGLFRELV